MDKILEGNRPRRFTFLVAIGIAVVGGIFAFPSDYISSANSVIGFCLLPFVFFVNGQSRFNLIYFLFTLFFAGTGFLYHVKIFYFLALAFYLLFCFELLKGKVNPLVLFLMVLMSPVFYQVSVIFGFPIRLYLSQWAGSILAFVGMSVKVRGNLMLINGFDFAVDEACMGLSMLTISMLMAVFVLVHQYRSQGRQLHLTPLLVFFAIVFALTIVSNLLRIIALVFFKVLPDQPLHEVIGLLCLVFYVMAPLLFISKRMVWKLGTESPVSLADTKSKVRHQFFVVSFGIVVMLVGLIGDFKISEQKLKHADVELGQLPATKMDGGITKLFDGELLVYVKPIPEFFSGEHTPLICWKGSGYEFKNIRKEIVQGREIYFGVLQREDDTLYTAWWYYNGKIETIDQLKWRTEMLTGGQRYNLVNVTAKDEETLKRRLNEIFHQRTFKINA